jgi:AcrR family transcriptional regulator
MVKSSDPGHAAPGRTGRRRGSPATRAVILEAARAAFAAAGYAGASLREIARAAGVDPALVHYYFPSKDVLFVEALGVPNAPGPILAAAFDPGLDGAGERFVGRLVAAYEQETVQRQFRTLFRAALEGEPAQSLMTAFIGHIAGEIARRLEGPDAAARAETVMSLLLGAFVYRYLVPLPPLSDLDPDAFAAALAPAVQAQLTPPPGSSARVPMETDR